MTHPPAGPAAWTVALSGSVPAPAELAANGWSELDFRITVRHLVHALLNAGARLVHGSHPTFVPLIEWEASRLPAAPGGKPVVLVTIPHERFFPTEDEWARYAARHGRYADVRPVGGRQAHIPTALKDLRREVLGTAQALVCVGGRGRQHSLNPDIQVKQEVDDAVGRGLAVFLVGSCGGLVRELFDDDYAHRLDDLRNGLTPDRSRFLATQADPAEAAALVLHGLAAIHPPPPGGRP